MNIGVYCPRYLIAKYNTDHRISKSFKDIQDYTNIRTYFAASNAYTFTFNFNKVIKHFIKRSPTFILHGLRDSAIDLDLLYHYGEPYPIQSFFKSVNKIPVFVTSGFMTDNYVQSLFGNLPNRQKEADEIARKLDEASMIHFHTEGGRQRFLKYRPEFKEKTVSIPFFLPNLSLIDKDDVYDYKNEEQIDILFVGYDGKRKGLFKILEALDILGHQYLTNRKVKVTIISKDKPVLNSKLEIKWHPKLPHDQVIKLLKHSSIFILAPTQESYGLVFVEAMAAGCAIIADDDETRKEILGECGLHVNPNSSLQIVEALRLLIEDNYTRRELGKMASHRYRKVFSPNMVANQYKLSFEATINNK